MNNWKGILVFLGLASAIAGCGGGGAGGVQTAGQSARGTVTLPPGFKLPISRLTVATEAGRVPLAANGSFTAPVSNAGPRLAQLIDTTTGKVVLIGYVDSSASGSMFAGGKSQISTLTSASALLFYGLSGPNLPPAVWEDYVESIMVSSQATTLAKTITSSVASNPTAMTDGDASIEGAVASVQATAGPRSLPSPMPHSLQEPPQKASVIQVTETQTQTGTLISVNPQKAQAGIVVQPNPNGDGIVVVNNLRRRAALYAYEVGTGQTANTVVPLPQPVTEIVDEEIEPEEALDSVYKLIYHGLISRFPYQPATSGPFQLPADKLSPVTVYDVVVVGTGLEDTTSAVAVDVAPKNFQLQPQLVAAWKATSSQLAMETLAKDVIEPIILSLVLDSKSAESATADPEFEQNVETLAKSLEDVGAALAARNVKLAAATFFNDVVKSPSIKDSLIRMLGNWAVSKNVFVDAAQMETAEAALDSLDTLMIAVNKCFLSVDLTNIYADSTEHENADDWVATVLHPKITLSPNPAIVNDIQNIAVLSTTVQNVSDLSNLRFKWSTTGTEGSLEEPFSSIPMPTGITSFSQSAYLADLPKLKSGIADTVTVTVYAANDLSTPLGTATAAVKAQPGSEYGRTFIDSDDDFQGLIDDDPWVISVVATCPFVKGATSYIVEAYGPTTGNFTYFVSTAGGALQVLDGDKKPYSHYLATGSGVTIAIAGMDATNEKVAGIAGATAYLQKVYPVTTVLVTYK